MEATDSKLAPSSASTGVLILNCAPQSCELAHVQKEMAKSDVSSQGVFVAHFLSGLSPEHVPNQQTPSTFQEQSSFLSSGPNPTPTALIPPTKHLDQLENLSVICSELERSATDVGAVLMADWELTRLSVRELNQRLVGQNRSVVSALKQKRRTLKNRGYALNCRTRRMRNQQQLEAENDYLRQLVAKQSALLAKYEQKLVGRETGKADNDNVEGLSREKWPEREGVAPRQNNNASPADGAATSVKSLINSSSAQMPTAHFRQYNGTVNSSSPQQQELFYPIVYQQQQQFPTTELQFPYYPVFKGNGAQEAAAQFQNWNQYQ
uniref:BZIP_Maf domain-containing protein n=1 Tax=Globodera pallida TaxID=36090 RepID=A0A183C3S2_GLOPA